MRRFLTAGFLLIAAGLYVQPAAARLDENRSLQTRCPMSFELPVTVECGMVAVPEDHRNPTGPTIQIAYARLGSTAPNPAPDPVIFISGGPGEITLYNIELLTQVAAPLVAQRDVILFDQRGVGFSQPGVDCPELTALFLWQAGGQFPSVVEAARACHQRLIASGLNLSVYTTTQVAADIPYLTRALGYETWNVYGVSYGTLVVLVLMEQQPAGLRSVVLDSMLVPDTDVIGDRVESGAAGFAGFFQSCEADWLCRLAYPDLDWAYNQAVDRLNAAPATRTITDRQTGQPVTLKLDGAIFASFAAYLLNTDKGRAALPGFIYAGRDGLVEDLLDDIRLEDQYNQLAATVGKPGTAGNGMSINVICADWAPRARPDAIPEMERFPVIGGSAYALIAPCPVWTTEGSDGLPDRPVRSSIPTLILSGDYDLSTPPRYAEHAAETLPNSQIVRFPRAGHGDPSTGQCCSELAAAFYHQPWAKVDTTCADHQPAAPLVLTVGATRPLARWIVLPIFALAGITTMVVTCGGLARLMARRQTAFWHALRRNTWLGVVIGGALVSLSLITRGEGRPLDAIVSIIPVVIAVQVALVTAIEEEPYLEALLACPRPFYWIMLERWLVIAGLQIPVVALGIAASALFLGDGDITYALTQIIPATLLLSGLGVLVSVRSKHSNLGALVVFLAWMGFFAIRNVVLITGLETPFPRPLNLVQSVLWMVHPYQLKPGSFTPGDTFTTRIITSGVGLALLGWALALLNNIEYLLVGRRPAWPWPGWLRKGAAPVAGGLWSHSSVLSTRNSALLSRVQPTINVDRWTQLCAMMRLEVLMSWRRGGLKVILLMAVVLPPLFSWIFPIDRQIAGMLAQLWPADALRLRTAFAISNNAFVGLAALFLLPLMLSEVIPLDEQYRTREWMSALPLPAWVYLAGKLLAFWNVALLGLGLTALISCGIIWIQYGPLDLPVLLSFWGGAYGLLALFSTQMGIMLAAGQPTRRQAIPLGIAAVLLALGAYFVLPANDFLWQSLLISTAAAYYPGRFNTSLLSFPSLPDYLLRIGLVVLAMIAVWFITWWRSEHRQPRSA